MNPIATNETMKATRPIFIAGCGRSGTSFLRTLIDAHPQVYIPSESLFIVDYLRNGQHLPDWLLRPLLYHEPQLLSWYQGEPILASTIADTLSAIHERMAVANQASIWGQKTPRFIRYRHLIDKAFGGCSWILIYRDPRAVCASMRRSGQHTNSVSRACRRWKQDNGSIFEYLRTPERNPDNVYIVKYEDLVTDLESSMPRIFRFIGIPDVPIDTLLADSRPVFFKGSGFSNNTIRDGMTPNPERVSDWENILTPPEIRYIESACSLEMSVMNYNKSNPVISGSMIFSDGIRKIQDLSILFRYMRYWPSYPLYTAIRKAALLLFSVFDKR